MAELKAYCANCGRETPARNGYMNHSLKDCVTNLQTDKDALQSELDTAKENYRKLDISFQDEMRYQDKVRNGLKLELSTLKQSVNEAVHEIFDTLMKYHPADDDKTHPKTYIDGASMALAVISKHGLIGKEARDDNG